ncbi:uncharacterized protein LOC133184523 [Saccostrea echinata]|uniref:uncharacterized protein LOC133184523 n=1 Tax=Saccostrea echinata TaxID=191078 RepID=UPI002A83970A|nr:uncharacterized protein LOC133184523 [Saccostrea echinata]
MSKRKHLLSLALALPKEADMTAKYLRFKAIELTKNDNKEPDIFSTHCICCGSVFTPDSCRTRLRPKLTLNKNLKRLLERNKTNPESLGKYQQNLIKRYLNGKNVVIKTCLQCSKTSKFPAQTRAWQMKRTRSLKPAPAVRETEPTEIEDKMLTRKQRKRLKKKQLKTLIAGDKDNVELSQTQAKEADSGVKNKPETAVHKIQNKNSFVTKAKVKSQYSGKLGQRLKGKNRHQQLSKMLAKEKTNNKPESLSMFLSSL